MSDLTIGTDSGGWSQGSPVYNKCTKTYVSGGVVWMGDEPPTKADFEQAAEIFQKPVTDIKFDVPTFFGYPSFYTRMREGDDPCYANETVVLG